MIPRGSGEVLGHSILRLYYYFPRHLAEVPGPTSPEPSEAGPFRGNLSHESACCWPAEETLRLYPGSNGRGGADSLPSPRDCTATTPGGGGNFYRRRGDPPPTLTNPTRITRSTSTSSRVGRGPRLACGLSGAERRCRYSRDIPQIRHVLPTSMVPVSESVAQVAERGDRAAERTVP